MHRAIVDIYIIKCQPATDKVGRHALPIGVVLVPKDRAAVVGGFVEGLVMEELDIGADKILGDLEDTLIVQQLPKVEAAFAHLHNLQHLLIGVVFFIEIVGVVDSMS